MNQLSADQWAAPQQWLSTEQAHQESVVGSYCLNIDLLIILSANQYYIHQSEGCFSKGEAGEAGQEAVSSLQLLPAQPPCRPYPTVTCVEFKVDIFSEYVFWEIKSVNKTCLETDLWEAEEYFGVNFANYLKNYGKSQKFGKILDHHKSIFECLYSD